MFLTKRVLGGGRDHIHKSGCRYLEGAARGPQPHIAALAAVLACSLAASDVSRSYFAVAKQEEQDNLEDFITCDSFLLLFCFWQ